MVDKVKSGTTGGLGKIQMDGFDPNNIPSDITNSINTGVASGNKKQPPILKEVVAVSNSTTADTNPVYISVLAKQVQLITKEVAPVPSPLHLGNNSLTFNNLSTGTYNNCEITVTDSNEISAHL